MPAPPTRSRAPALSVEERRAAIVTAALPLVLHRGAAVTTKEIAAAAQVAEGTIFRVFSDKAELLSAIVTAGLDPAPLEQALSAIDVALPLEARLTAAVDVLRERVGMYVRLTEVRGPADPTPSKAPERLPQLEALLEPDAALFRLPVAAVAHLLRGVIVVHVHPTFHPGPARSSSEIVDLFLHGTVNPPEIH